MTASSIYPLKFYLKLWYSLIGLVFYGLGSLAFAVEPCRKLMLGLEVSRIVLFFLFILLSNFVYSMFQVLIYFQRIANKQADLEVTGYGFTVWSGYKRYEFDWANIKILSETEYKGRKCVNFILDSPPPVSRLKVYLREQWGFKFHAVHERMDNFYFYKNREEIVDAIVHSYTAYQNNNQDDLMRHLVLDE